MTCFRSEAFRKLDQNEQELRNHEHDEIDSGVGDLESPPQTPFSTCQSDRDFAIFHDDDDDDDDDEVFEDSRKDTKVVTGQKISWVYVQYTTNHCRI